MWLARRALTKSDYPGMWDNLVGGGLRAGCTVAQDLRRECAEEAGIAAELAERARPAGLISYCKEVEHGLAPNLALVYDLELDPAFEPVPVDGEVERFALMPIDDVHRLVAGTTTIKPNCNLVIIDFLVRHGLIAPDAPGYVEIVARLRSGSLPRLGRFV
jgi:8-oxo-dGTP pyrophosphatase MutT (NUDIX family)